MRIRTHRDRNHRPGRSVSWSQRHSRLLIVVQLAVVTAICAASIVGAIELHGVPRVVATVFVVLFGLVLAGWIALVVLMQGVFSMLERKPSVARHAARVLLAAGFGALCGTATYLEGVQGLLAGPVVILLLLAIFRTYPHITPRGHLIALEMSVIAGITAVGVGLTIFL